MTNQDAANKTYREFIDGLVDAAPSLAARLVREEGIASKAPAAVAANDLVSRLSLTWWLDTGSVRWSAGEESMPGRLGADCTVDFVGRLEGWDWPD